MTDKLAKKDNFTIEQAQAYEEQLKLKHEAYLTKSKAHGKYLWQGGMTDQQAEMVKAIAVEYGLDPFMRHLQVLGGNLYITVSALQFKAAEKGFLKNISYRAMTKAEREDLIPAPPDDMHCYIVDIETKDGGRVNEFGFASPKDVSSQVASKGYPSLAAMARTRATGRALRLLLNINLPIYEELNVADFSEPINSPTVINISKVEDLTPEEKKSKAERKPESKPEVKEEKKEEPKKEAVDKLEPETEEGEETESDNGIDSKKTRRSYRDLIVDKIKTVYPDKESQLKLAKELKLKTLDINHDKELEPSQYQAMWAIVKPMSNDELKNYIKEPEPEPEKQPEPTPQEEEAKPEPKDEDTGMRKMISNMLFKICGSDSGKLQKEISSATSGKYKDIKSIDIGELKPVLEKLEIRLAEIITDIEF